MTNVRSMFGWGSLGQLLRPGQLTDHSGCRQQNAMHVEEPDFDYYHNLATKLQYDLEHNKHRDAFAEVMVLKYNILHAFMESAEHPHQVHGRPNLIPEVRAIDIASDNVALCFATPIFVQREVCFRCCRYACPKEMPVHLKLGPSLKNVLWHCFVSLLFPEVSQCSLVLNGGHVQAKQAKWHNIKGSMLSWLHRDTLPWGGATPREGEGPPDLPDWSKKVVEDEIKRAAAAERASAEL